MRTIKSVLPVLLILAFLLGGCGYYFPHVYDGPTKKIYMANWKNRTSNLGLDSDIYQSLSSWFQKSQAIILTKNKEDADLILAGEIMSIDLPSISWTDTRATEVRVRLDVRYILKDLQTDEILWEVPKEIWTEEYPTTGGSAAMADNEKKALDQILDDLSERLYLGTLEKLRQMNR
ncbi:MAG: LPS assembly lipoprotein LptE [Desulfobulbaceae bacterium]|nr:LPS assembly lipoprotein LptE [Desulfobulbaceae bacterium]